METDRPLGIAASASLTGIMSFRFSKNKQTNKTVSRCPQRPKLGADPRSWFYR